MNSKQTLLNTNNKSYNMINGVTYFKLRSDFEGDYTKNCGLLGEEIDSNFYFLRGYDIKNMYLNDKKELIIERVDEEYLPLKVNIGEDYSKYIFSFDEENGIINITFPDGTKSKMDGFLVEGKDIKISTDGSIDGNGTMYNPLRLSDGYKTGTYAPVEELFDLTINNNMPKGKGNGYRIITKEKIDNFGCLYPFSSVKKIQDKLIETKSQWRIPSKKDWDDLLNAMEINPSNRNHNSIKNTWLGEMAGSALKSSNMWETYKNLSTEIPTEGQDVAGLKILPLGIGPDRNSVIDDKNFDIEGFAKLAGMWTSTIDESGNAYAKLFGYNSSKVDQDTYGEGSRMSIRLVKDYDLTNYNDIEYILNLPYPTKLVYGICNDINYAKIWTTINFYDSSIGLDGKRSDEWNVVSDSDRGIKIVYFINEWDGNNWIKKLMDNGDSVVIKNHNNFSYHEWRVINEELIDTSEIIMNEFNKTLLDINNKLNEEIKNREESDNKLLNAIQKETEIRLDVDNQLHDAIISESKLRETVDKQLNEAIVSESKLRENVDKQLHNAIVDEGLIRKEQDDLLRNSILEESNIRKLQDEKLLEILQKETEVRTNVDNQLRDAIKSESEIRKNVDDQLLNAIRNEGEIRKNNDIKPGNYIIESDYEKEMIIPTFGENISDIKIKISSDFFNFGKIINNDLN